MFILASASPRRAELLTQIGASANVIVAGMAAERGVPMTFMRFMALGFPLMILTILASTVYVYLRYLM